MNTWDRPLTDDEQGLVNHITRWGSDGYPVRRFENNRGWTWDFRSCRAPVVYKTKREATAAFEVFLEVLHSCLRAEAQRRALWRQVAATLENEPLRVV